MCQAYEGEANLVRWMELAEIKSRYQDHVSGENPLTDDELEDLAIQKLMLLDN